jgi:hypothetical protein
MVGLATALESARPRHYLEGVTTADDLAPEQRAWLARDEKRWRRAHAIAAAHPGVDVGGVYHVLRNLEKTPSQRLRDALRHGRFFRSHAR